MSTATVNVCTCGSFWLKSVAMVLFMLFNILLVEWLLLYPCCVMMCGILFVMYDVFSSILNYLEKGKIDLYEVPRLFFLFCFEIGMCGKMFVLRASACSCVRWMRPRSLSTF